MFEVLIPEDIKPGFNEALATLEDYKPIKIEEQLNDNSVALAPNNCFVESVKIGDFVLQ